MGQTVETELGFSVLGIGTSTLGSCSREPERCSCCCRDKISISGNMSAVQTPTLTHVGPELVLEMVCGCALPQVDSSGSEDIGEVQEEVLHDLPADGLENLAPSAHAVLSAEAEVCTENFCQNGGRCLVGDRNKPWCICPPGTEGPTCKVTTRQYYGVIGSQSSSQFGSWSWLSPLPSCSKLHISLYLLTRKPNGLFLYSGNEQFTLYQPYIALQLVNGLPQAMVRATITGPTTTLTLNTMVADNQWHRIDILWVDKTLLFYVDQCSSVKLNPFTTVLPSSPPWTSTPQNPVNFSECRQAARLLSSFRKAGLNSPLQLGSKDIILRNDANLTQAHESFTGCISAVRINNKLQDLGSSVVGGGTRQGCDKYFCLKQGSACPQNSRCAASEAKFQCVCDWGFEGSSCTQSTVPAMLTENSFAHIALSFAPQLYSNVIQFRIRTREPTGLVISLSSHHRAASLSILLRQGRACVQLWHPPLQDLELCLRAAVSDGAWHTVTAMRFGSNLELSMDGGDEAGKYGSFFALNSGEKDDDQSPILSEPRQLKVHRQEGVLVGGVPVFDGTTAIAVQSDLRNTCLDDLRLDGYSVPLIPYYTFTKWGALTYEQGFRQSCDAPDSCANVTCAFPLVCRDTWRRQYCGCPEGHAVSQDHSSCCDIDECVWQPCFHGGTCTNRDPGFHCSCPAGYSGLYCQWNSQTHASVLSSVGIIQVTCAVTGAIFVLLVFILALVCHRKRLKKKRHSEGTFSPHSDDVALKYSSTTNASHPKTLSSGESGLPLTINLQRGDNEDIFKSERVFVKSLGVSASPGAELSFSELPSHGEQTKCTLQL
ncbi:Laminin G domain [Trinorchestia longiramus]|nr:Laminin G domain [Trinorchestia longiramus]